MIFTWRDSEFFHPDSGSGAIGGRGFPSSTVQSYE